MNVGVIGLGRIGAPIAKHVVEAGYRVHAYDIRPIAVSGTVRCASASDVAGVCDIVITSLPGPQEVHAVMLDVLKTARTNTVIVETSTIGPAQSRSLSAQFARRGAAYLDAPVSGGVEAAVAGTLAVMVGGKAVAFEQARPVIQRFAKHIFHLGPTGAGNSMKLVIQAMFLSQVAAFLEAVSVGQGAGIPLEQMLEIVAASSAHHPGIAKRYEKMIANDLTPRFEVRSALKDLTLAQECSREFGCRTEVLDAAISAYRRAAAAGFSENDLIALQKVTRPART